MEEVLEASGGFRRRAMRAFPLAAATVILVVDAWSPLPDALRRARASRRPEAARTSFDAAAPACERGLPFLDAPGPRYGNEGTALQEAVPSPAGATRAFPH